MAIEKILFITVCYDGPIAGFSGSRGCTKYFKAPFDDELDEYSDLYKVLALNYVEQEVADSLIDGGLFSRYSKSVDLLSLIKRLEEEMEKPKDSKGSRFSICRPNIRTVRGWGADGVYTVDWELVI
jgi:hypothetical protein